MCQCDAILISGSNDSTKRIFPNSWFHIFFIFSDRQITNLDVNDELEVNTSTNSSLERVHANPFHGIRLVILKIIGKKVANA